MQVYNLLLALQQATKTTLNLSIIVSHCCKETKHIRLKVGLAPPSLRIPNVILTM